MIRALQRLRASRSGSTIVEFGILAPIIITLFMGILQVGIWMQSYNALRSVAADAGRYTAVQYQKSNRIDNLAIATWARDWAIDHYLFKSDKLSTDVTPAATQRITGVTELTLTITYKYESYLSIIGITDPDVTFARPIFVKSA